MRLKIPGCFSRVKLLLLTMLLGSVLTQPATAHLMVAQRGTLNIVDNGVFMVLSLPVSAFNGIDDDSDGKMSLTEFTRHRPAIVKAINDGVQLHDQEGLRPLEGMMLTPVTSHATPKAPVEQLIVMGKFGLPQKLDEKLSRELAFYLGLFGKRVEEQLFTVTSKYRIQSKKHEIELTPDQAGSRLFPAEVD